MEINDSLLSVITLNYKNPELTVKCVENIIGSAERARIQTEIFVVDNSAAETANILNCALPESVQIIENLENVGFSKANNQAIRLSRGRYILLLNNDAFLTEDCLELGLHYLKNNPKVGLWAPRLKGTDGNLQVSCFKFPSLLSLAGEYYFKKNINRFRDWKQWKEPMEVDALIGAFLLIPINVIEHVGLLNEVYFFTAEDIDYCARVRKSGYSIVYDPRVSIVHVGGSSQKDFNWLDDKNLHRSRILYFTTHHGRFIGFVARIIIQSGLALRRLKG